MDPVQLLNTPAFVVAPFEIRVWVNYIGGQAVHANGVSVTRRPFLQNAKLV